jgi:cold shock CspA family protein/arsenate reductase-like glutaredoxin family protein
MLTGTIKFFNKAKGFGFITPDDGGKEVFLPSVTAAGADLKPGQRVSFEQEADVKGPKAIKLELLERKAPVPASIPASAPATPAMTLYCDPASSHTSGVHKALTALGHEPRLIDYTLTPPAAEDLRKLSLMLSEAGQNLVRRFDPLFLALQLDDRFITQSEFWTAVFQHPVLINGPVLVAAGKARICKTAEDVRDFLGLTSSPVAKSKALSPRLAALISGQAVASLPERPAAPAPSAAPARTATKKAVTTKPASKPVPAKKAAKPAAPAKKPMTKKKKA